MKIDLNLPRGEHQRLFLDYLNSALRQRHVGYHGSAGLRQDGFFESSVRGKFLLDEEQPELIWKVIKSKEGTLHYIEVLPSDQDSPDHTWELAVHEFITSVLSAALAEKRQPFFQRVFFNYIGTQLDGEYWFQRIRFAPLWPEDPYPGLFNAERVVTFDMTVNAIDKDDALTLSREIARRQAARFSLLLNIGLYSQSHEHRWVIKESTFKSERLQLGFIMQSTNISKMPAKGELCPLGKYSESLSARYRSAGRLISFPSQARQIFRAIDLAPPEVTDAFDHGARLCQVAAVVGHQFPSVGLAYRIAAIEAISKADKTSKNFGEFVRKHVASKKNLEEILDYMYGKVRSGHFHSGEFPLGEYNRETFIDPFMDSDLVEQMEIHDTCHEIVRKTIVNWICSLLPKTTEQQEKEVAASAPKTP